MSDLYDSLEDDSDGNENSRDFLNRPQDESSESLTDTNKCDSVDKYSFFLNFDKIPQKQHLDPLFTGNKTQSEEKEVSFEIENNKNEQGLSSVPYFIVGDIDLSEKGLQLNKDGSFTRSPRLEEKLPFIAREYKNLKFQKKKTYLSSMTKLTGEMSSKDQLNVISHEKSRETFPTSKNSSVKSVASRKQFQPKQNMTDSMKERLLKRFEEATLKKYEAPGNERYEKLERKGRGTKEEKKFEGKRGPLQKNILPQLTTTRPKLNYSERRQLENGFNPLSLRQEGKGVPEDTNRSNYGDSVRQDLPEISSRVVSCENLLDSEEEMFYKKIIQKEKTLNDTARTCRSDGPVHSKLNRIVRRNSCRDGLESAIRKNISKNSVKSTFIDMPAESNHSEINSKRFSHYCSSNNTSRNASKMELAIKARTYGCLVNARNIFKLKAQSERKFSALEKQKNEKSNEDSNLIIHSSLTLSKQHSLPTNCFQPVKGTLIRNLSKQSVSPRKAQPMATKGSTRGIVLPQVTSSQVNHKMTPEMFSKISSCLSSE